MAVVSVKYSHLKMKILITKLVGILLQRDFMFAVIWQLGSVALFSLCDTAVIATVPAACGLFQQHSIRQQIWWPPVEHARTPVQL